jgi:ABC-2 type transport system ATP-binding protein
VLDEPTNGLDPRQVIEWRGLLRGLARHCAILLTSHILSEIERIADRVAILRDGRLLAVHALAGAGKSGVLRLSCPAELAPRVAAILAALPGIAEIASAEPAAGTKRWHLRAETPAIATDLAARFGAEGIASIELHDERSDLEDLFLRLTAPGQAA